LDLLTFFESNYAIGNSLNYKTALLPARYLLEKSERVLRELEAMLPQIVQAVACQSEWTLT